VTREAARNALRKEWFMRRFKRFYVAVGLALAATLAFASVGNAVSTPDPSYPNHVFDASFTQKPPKGFPKDKPQPGALHVDLEGNDDPNTPDDPAPPKVTSVALDVDKSIHLSGQGLPVCNADLESTPATGPGSATELCGPALLGTGSAAAQIGTTILQGTGLIFNGPNNTIIVHIRVDAISTTVVVSGQIGTSPDQSLYDQRLSFPNIPPIAGGAGSLKSLVLDIEKTVKKQSGKAATATASKKKKKKKKYISWAKGKCTDGTYNFANNETYSDHVPIHETVEQPCQQK
jgi:hypothetical protein